MEYLLWGGGGQDGKLPPPPENIIINIIKKLISYTCIRQSNFFSSHLQSPNNTFDYILFTIYLIFSAVLNKIRGIT